MAEFKTAYSKTCRFEGGYANNAFDRGGETYKGVSRNNFPSWDGWTAIDAAKKEKNFPINLNYNESLQKSVSAFYKQNFWNKLNLDAVQQQTIADELFDTAVNMGVGIAANFIQRALNVCNRNGSEYADINLDGQVGPKTVATLNQHKRPAEILKVLNCLQGERYITICEHNRSQEIFLRSWLSRVAL